MDTGSPKGLSLDAASKALADVGESLRSAQSQLPTKLSLPRGIGLPNNALSSSSPDALPKLPSLPGWPATTPDSPPGEFFARLSSLANGAGLNDLASQASRISREVASSLPLTPAKYAALSDRAGGASAQASAQASARLSQALDSLVATNPRALGLPAEHLRASLSHGLASVEQAYAAGATLVPEEYHPLVLTLALGTVSTAIGMSVAASRERKAVSNAPLPREYDLPAIMGYYNRRPLTLLGRLFEVSYRLGSLGAKLWLDRKVGDGSGWEKNMDSRAEEFVDFVQGAGPAFIKIGQGVSIRPDILPEPYLKELVKLQDRVRSVRSRAQALK